MPAPSAQDLDRLARAVGEALPESYLSFIGRHHGAEPPPNGVGVGNGNQSGVRRFVAVSTAPLVLPDVEGFPSHVIPIAEDDSGNFFYMAAAEGTVRFWDHEIEGGDSLVADDLDSFLSLLEPFDAARVALAPGQVRRAWIDPDFDPEFRAREFLAPGFSAPEFLANTAVPLATGGRRPRSGERRSGAGAGSSRKRHA